MDFLTLIPILETTLTRTVVSRKNNTDTISYNGDITSVTVNNEDTHTNVYQIFLTHDDNDLITMHVNHTRRNHTTDYLLSEVSSLVIT